MDAIRMDDLPFGRCRKDREAHPFIYITQAYKVSLVRLITPYRPTVPQVDRWTHDRRTQTESRL